tara:strand:- start:337 stop:840 length:504 start_codon:yes stop_codon:yes gene_type:complete
MNLFRKVSLFFIILAFISKIVLASNYNFESNANGIFEIQSIMLIDEMPAQFNGKVNTSGDVDYNGEKLKSVTSCLYSVIIKDGVAVYRGTCRDYFDEENVLYTSIVSEYNFPANGAESVVTVLGGEGIFEDATGEGTNNWNSAGITDPNNSNMGYLKVTTNLNIITE